MGPTGENKTSVLHVADPDPRKSGNLAGSGSGIKGSDPDPENSKDHIIGNCELWPVCTIGQ